MGHRPVLLVGSVPLASASEVFTATAKHLGTLAPCLPTARPGLG